MVSQQLLDYIKEQLEKGARDSDIKNILLEYGWAESDVDQALTIVHPNNASIVAQIEKLEQTNKKSGRLIKVLITTFLLVITLLVVAAGFYWVIRNKSIENEARLNKNIQNVKPTSSEILETEKTTSSVQLDIPNEEIDPTVTSTAFSTSTMFATSTMVATSTATVIDKTVIKCGQIEIDTPEIVQTAMKKCFQDNLKTCTKAQIILTKDVGQLGGTTTSDYEIIGANSNLCSVKVRFLQNPNPEWNNKEMYCDYSKTKNFEISFSDITGCKGPLYDLMAKGI